jgi:2-C-methyl-D-erythritol 4-phosphate cytidylyltransferase
MSSYAILLAGGSGSRMRGAVKDKILEPILGVPALVYSVRAFLAAGIVDRFVIVRDDDARRADLLGALAAHGHGDLAVTWASGGAERRDSVLNGLEAAPAGAEWVFIHDGARPLVRPESLRALASAARLGGAAALAHRVKDTIKQAPRGALAGEPVELRDLDRPTLWAMETPQAFSHPLILAAYRRAVAEGVAITDDVAAATHAGHRAIPVENFFPNPKLTEPADFAWVEFLLKRDRPLSDGDGDFAR